MSKGVWFGDIIHKLKPANFNEWNDFLKSNKFFFIKNLKCFKQYEHQQWIFYLQHSFWKLYKSECKAIDYFKELGILLFFTDHRLDQKYGFDFYFYLNEQINYLIVKHSLRSNFFCSRNLKKNVWVFDSLTTNLFNCNGELISNPLNNNQFVL